MPLSFCAPVVPSNATKFPSTGLATLSGFSVLRVSIFSRSASWSAAVKYRPIISPFPHARAAVPFWPRVIVRSFPSFAVMSTVSAVAESAPMVR